MQSKSIVKLAGLFIVLCLCLAGVNIITAPIIEKNSAAGEFEPLYAVMPDAAGFEAVSDLNDVDAKVLGVYSETSGLGYVVTVESTEGYTGDPIDLTIAFDMDGKVSAINCTNYPETKEVGDDFIQSFVGEDSTMADVNLVAGVTYASSAIKNAVQAGFDVLINNNLLAAGQMGPEQILTNLMLENDHAMASASGAAQYEEISVDGYAKAYKALNESGYAFISVDGDTGYLTLANSKGYFDVYDMEGNNVSSEKAELGAPGVTAVGTTDTVAKDLTKLAKMGGVDESALTAVSLDGVYSTVSDAYVANGNYYFVAKTYGFNNEVLTEYVILNSNGEIVKMAADAYIIEPEYFSVKVDGNEYSSGFTGLTADTFDGSQALVAGATMTSNAFTVGTQDIFAAYQTIVGGEE